MITAGVVAGLTSYTFYAVRRGADFGYLGPVLWACLMGMLFFALTAFFVPMGPVVHSVYAGIGAVVFSGYIVCDTDLIVRRLPIDEYIWGAMSLYIDIVNLFLFILDLLNGGRR